MHIAIYSFNCELSDSAAVSQFPFAVGTARIKEVNFIIPIIPGGFLMD